MVQTGQWWSLGPLPQESRCLTGLQLLVHVSNNLLILTKTIEVNGAEVPAVVQYRMNLNDMRYASGILLTSKCCFTLPIFSVQGKSCCDVGLGLAMIERILQIYECMGCMVYIACLSSAGW